MKAVRSDQARYQNEKLECVGTRQTHTLANQQQPRSASYTKYKT